MTPAWFVGTSGWSHEDWVGPFYPVHLRARPADWLDHYASRFRAVEIAASFDAFPDPGLVDAWARAGARLLERGAFEFSLVLPRVVTDALASGDVALAREWTGRFDREVLDPLAGEGVLGAVLARVPAALAPSPRAAADLQEALAPLAERRVAIELPGAAWCDDDGVVPHLDKLFAGGEVCLVESDGVDAVDARAPVGARHAYLRFRGRAADGDHLYAREDLAPWVERIREHERAGREVRALFANVARAQAVANAIDLRELLGAPTTLPRPRLTAQQRLQL